MIKAILAVDSAFGIGKDGVLPWPLIREDMKRFRVLTTGNIIVMGSKTWHSITPKPLVNRMNVVVSSNMSSCIGCDLVIDSKDMISSISFLQFGNPDKDVWIIGGAQLLSSCIPIIEEFYITRVNGDFSCDTFFDEKHITENFILRDSEFFDDNLTFQIWKRP